MKIKTPVVFLLAILVCLRVPANAETAIPGLIQSTSFMPGGQNVGYYDTTPGYGPLCPGWASQEASFPGTDVEIAQAWYDRASDGSQDNTSSPTASVCLPGCGYFDVWMSNTEWLKYTITAANSGNYIVTLRLGYGDANNVTMHVELDSVNVTGPVVLPQQTDWGNGSPWHHFFDQVLPSFYISAGSHTLTVFCDSGATGNTLAGGNVGPELHYIYVTNDLTSAPVPVFTCATSANGTMNQQFSFNAAANNNPTNYSASGLPSGLSMHPNSGTINGTPTQSGSFTVHLSAANANGTGTATLSLYIDDNTPGLALYRINCGGGAIAPFTADDGNSYYLSGGATYSTTATIDTSYATNAAPSAVYQSMRYTDNLGYVFSGLTPGKSYLVRLHFAEISYTSAGSRLFNILVRNVQVATNFDIVVLAGGANRAVTRTYTTAADSSGNLDIWLHASSPYTCSISGLEILNTGGSVQPQRPNISGMSRSAGNKPRVSWTTDSGVTYAVYKSTNLLTGWIANPLTNIVGDGTAKAFVDATATQRTAYYRITAR